MKTIKSLYVGLALLLALISLHSVAAADGLPTLTPQIPPNAVDPHCSTSSKVLPVTGRLRLEHRALASPTAM
jgi:hypothetical protein